MTIAIYPGTFDPLTNGHVDIVKRVSMIFDKTIVAVADSADKKPYFSFADRFALCKATFASTSRVYVDHFSGLLVDYVREKQANVILRGLRGVSDIDFEFQLSEMNRMMSSQCDTLFIKASGVTASISSTMVREIAKMGGDVASLVPPAVVNRLNSLNNS